MQISTFNICQSQLLQKPKLLQKYKKRYCLLTLIQLLSIENYLKPTKSLISTFNALYAFQLKLYILIKPV